MALCTAAAPPRSSNFTSAWQIRSGATAGAASGRSNLCYRSRGPVKTLATFNTDVTLWLQDSGNNEDWEISFYLDTNRGDSWRDFKVTKDSQVTTTSPFGRWIARFVGPPTPEGKPPGIHFGSTYVRRTLETIRASAWIGHQTLCTTRSRASRLPHGGHGAKQRRGTTIIGALARGVRTMATGRDCGCCRMQSRRTSLQRTLTSFLLGRMGHHLRWDNSAHNCSGLLMDEKSKSRRQQELEEPLSGGMQRY